MNRIATTMLIISTLLSASYSDTEPNDTFGQATAITVNTTADGSLDTTDSDDWYRIVLPHDGALQVVVIPGSALNPHVKLFDQDGTTPLNFNGGAYSNQGSSGEPDTGYRADLKSGTYLVAVSRWNDGQGSYSIRAGFTPTEYPDNNDPEPNDSLSTAITLNVNASDTGHLGYYKDGATDRDDWYRIVLPHDGALRVVVIPGNALNTQVKLFDQDGTTPLNFNGGAYGNQGSFGEPDTAFSADLKSGTYYVTVSGWSGNGQGSYVLKASTGRDHSYSISIDPQVAHANLDTVRIRFNNRLIDNFTTCLNIGVISNENNQRFATYACLDGYMWIEHDSVLTIRFDTFSSLGSDTGTIGLILKKVQFQNGDTLDCDTIFFRWSASGTAIVKKSSALPEKYSVDDISYPKDKIAGIRIALPQPASVSISVYTLSGKLVTTKHINDMKAGYHTVSYHYGTLASGSYILKIRARNMVFNKRLNISR
ncbi:MAG: T9SS type A sorting domain-containing protein [Chitinispirillaceae bacterium]|nr:T9SS type A sorting domain-containing protein [Chitinispirillaceae bacterium]